MMKYLSLKIQIAFTVLCLFCMLGVAAQDLDPRLVRPIEIEAQCETIAHNASHLITSYSHDQYDSIVPVLKVWKEACGEVEPVRRLEILMYIAQDKNVLEPTEKFIDKYGKAYIHRIDPNAYMEDYESDKSYYSYIALHGFFDQWTAAFATQLLEKSKKGTDEHLILLLLSNQIEKFEAAYKKDLFADSYLVKQQKERDYEAINRRFSYKVLLGLWKPLGELNKTLNSSPQIGLAFLSPQRNNYQFQIKGMLTFLLDNPELDFNFDGRRQSTSDIQNITFGLGVIKERRINKYLMLDYQGGLNVNVLSTDIYKDIPDEDSNYHSSETVNLEFGGGLRTRVFKNKELGCNMLFHLVPYNLNRSLESRLGSSYVDFNLFFRF